MKCRNHRFAVAFFYVMEKITYDIIYHKIKELEDISLEEAVLLSSYIKKYEKYDKIIVSQMEDAKLIMKKDAKNISRNYWKKLSDKGYIQFTTKGSETLVKISTFILDKVGVKRKTTVKKDANNTTKDAVCDKRKKTPLELLAEENERIYEEQKEKYKKIKEQKEKEKKDKYEQEFDI